MSVPEQENSSCSLVRNFVIIKAKGQEREGSYTPINLLQRHLLLLFRFQKLARQSTSPSPLRACLFNCVYVCKCCAYARFCFQCRLGEFHANRFAFICIAPARFLNRKDGGQ